MRKTITQKEVEYVYRRIAGENRCIHCGRWTHNNDPWAICDDCLLTPSTVPLIFAKFFEESKTRGVMRGFWK